MSPVADRAIAYDLVTETAHWLNASGGELLLRCDGVTGIEATIDEWASASETDRSTVAADVERALAAFAELALVGRGGEFVPPDAATGSPAPMDPGAVLGAVHSVIDYEIVLRGPDRGLLADLDSYLGSEGIPRSGSPRGSEPDASRRAVGGDRTILIDVHRSATGELLLTADRQWRFSTVESCLEQLTGVFNSFAVRTRSCAALHAAALRSPGGEIVLLAAPSGSGKSTLAGALIAAGWDYLGDEAIGVRPGTCTAVGYPKRLGLDAGGREALGLGAGERHGTAPEELRAAVVRLGGDVGRIDGVILPSYVAGSELSAESLTPLEAAIELLANTLNLARVGAAGLDAVCGLAEGAPAHRLAYGDAASAAAFICGDGRV